MWFLIIFVLIGPVLDGLFQLIIQGGLHTLVLLLYMITPSPPVTITCFSAPQRKGCIQRRSRVISIDEIERCITTDSVVRCIDGEGQSLGILLPLLFVHIGEIHLERPSQCLYHPQGVVIGLRAICHYSALFLTGNTVECTKEI